MAEISTSATHILTLLQFGALLLRWISHDLFGTHTLGLGSYHILTEEESNSLGELYEVVNTHFPLLFMDIGSISVQNVG